MLSSDDHYWSATKHPWACVLFVVPLLAAYEIGLRAFGNAASDVFRNGADVWFRAALAEVGVSPLYGAPVLLVCILLLWGLVSHETRPLDKVGVWVGMAAESGGFALLLLGLSQGIWLLLLRADNVLGRPTQRIALLQWSSDPTSPESTWGQILSYLGAGIYEETLFRLVLFGGLCHLLALTNPVGASSAQERTRSQFNAVLAALASSFFFAGAHHLGASGEPFNVHVFCFRVFAGLYFAALYQLRGFGIAVGAHAGYDVLVGMILRT